MMGAEDGMMKNISSDCDAETSVESGARGAEGGMMEDMSSDSGSETPAEFGERSDK
jgi:hypothetical protein